VFASWCETAWYTPIRPAELLARRRVLDAELEHPLRDADRLGRHRRAGARNVARSGQRRAVSGFEASERPRRVDGRELLAGRVVRVPVHADYPVDRPEPRHEAVHGHRPLRLARRDRGPVLRPERGESEADGGE
jgi:hypothetical protein